MKWIFFYLTLLVIPLLTGCDERTEYQKLVDRELARGVRYDSLFLGYEFGMTRNEFYDHSWDLNRKGLVMQGPQNQTVEYNLDNNELPYSAKMNFYPDFYGERIFQMRVRFMYDGWAPWNKNLFSDSLQIDVVNLLTDWYGDDFIKVDAPKNGFEYIKVDGNRKIVVAKHTDSEVLAVFTDLIAEKEMEKQK